MCIVYNLKLCRLNIFFFYLSISSQERKTAWIDPCCGSHLAPYTSESDDRGPLNVSLTSTQTHTDLMLPSQKYICLSGHNGNITQLPGGLLRCTVLTFDKDVVTQFLRVHTHKHSPLNNLVVTPMCICIMTWCICELCAKIKLYKVRECVCVLLYLACFNWDLCIFRRYHTRPTSIWFYVNTDLPICFTGLSHEFGCNNFALAKCVCLCVRTHMLSPVCGQSVVAAVGGTAGQPDNRVWRDLTSTTTIFTRPKRGVRLVATHTHIHKNTHASS